MTVSKDRHWNLSAGIYNYRNKTHQKLTLSLIVSLVCHHGWTFCSTALSVCRLKDPLSWITALIIILATVWGNSMVTSRFAVSFPKTEIKLEESRRNWLEWRETIAFKKIPLPPTRPGLLCIHCPLGVYKWQVCIFMLTLTGFQSPASTTAVCSQ